MRQRAQDRTLHRAASEGSIGARGGGPGAPGQEGQAGGQQHICPQTGPMPVCSEPLPARTGGQQGGCAHSRFHPRAYTKLRLSILPRVGRPGVANAPASCTHGAAVLRHQISLTEKRI